MARSAASWAEKTGGARPDILRIGYFGSCTGERWGVGSDLDLFIEVVDSIVSFERRGAEFDTAQIPVGVDLLVYTTAELARMRSQGSSFLEGIERTAVWIYSKQ